MSVRFSGDGRVRPARLVVLTCWLTAAAALGGSAHAAVEPAAETAPVPIPGAAPVPGVALANAAEVDGGGYDICARTKVSTVICWGQHYGQTTRILGLNDASQVGMGWDHGCAVTATAAVKCWGTNSYGQLGNGVRGDASFNNAVRVTGLTGAVKVAAGQFFSCALVASGGVSCWGYNAFGQVAQPASTRWTLTPAVVAGLPAPATDISAGTESACARLTDSSVWCWGFNAFGQVGDGTTTNRFVATRVTVLGVGISSLHSTAAAEGTCGQSPAGIACWGYQPGPGPAPGLAALSISNGWGCAVVSASDVRCWGTNFFDQLGLPPGDSGKVVGLRPTLAVATAASTACALLTTGRVQCWGLNEHGELGDGTGGRQGPRRVTGWSNLRQLAAGGWHVCGLLESWSVQCFGDNGYRQIDPSAQRAPLAVTVPGMHATRVLSPGYAHTCAIDAAGVANCQGLNSYGALGNPTGVRSLQPVPGLVDPLDGSGSADDHRCWTTPGPVRCYGANWNGQLGDGTTSSSTTGVDVVGVSGASQVVSGSSYSCALTAAGAAMCWGSLSASPGWLPTTMSGLGSGVRQLAAGSSAACAVTTADEVWCWGSGPSGELGIGSPGSSADPVKVAGLPAVTSIVGGHNHFCAVTTTGVLWCWGLNDGGQLGDGTVVDRHAPVQVVGLPGPMTEAVAGRTVTCAEGGSQVWCWGDNQGVHGNGDGQRFVPVDVGPPGATAPSGASWLSARQAGGSVELAWVDNATNETNFRIERCGTPCTWATLATVAADTSTYVDSSAVAEVVYRYRITALRGTMRATYVPSATVRVVAAPAAPTLTGAGPVVVDWVDASRWETGYVVETCAGAGCSPSALAAAVGAGTTSASVETTPGTTSCARVRTLGAGGGASTASPTTCVSL